MAAASQQLNRESGFEAVFPHCEYRRKPSDRPFVTLFSRRSISFRVLTVQGIFTEMDSAFPGS
jgi:hypothetical protein